jgi:hypothetical protein
MNIVEIYQEEYGVCFQFAFPAFVFGFPRHDVKERGENLVGHTATGKKIINK